MRLSDLGIGESAVLFQFSEDRLGRALQRMGFRRGMWITPVLNRGALWEYRIESSLIAFPKNCSETIEIEQKTCKSSIMEN